ncbi:MAG TPA: glycosyltransferase family 4 protein [Candidatus Krumholzibacteria bacterium]|nr:glycosyltransferase family 4 protein [Candidatus Krumholzibacteria bacterium]HPD70405.1 glycosyltransferase family 4 protein [Candidatus Krumholzibacteria bacterium]HRY39895.1 glycosyltransferase family 4 protein [Candidatus Krumholzibacteria bacterium]
MKIALVETHAMPGMWKYDLGLARELERLGGRVTIFSAACFPRGEEPQGGVWRGFPDLRAQPNLVAKGLRYLAATVRMVAAVRRGGFDVVHWQHFNVLPPLEALTAQAFGPLRRRLVLTVHDINTWEAVKAGSPGMLRRTYGAAARLIVHHEANAPELARCFDLPADRIRVVPHGSYDGFRTTPVDRGAARRLLGIPAGAPLVLFFGEIRREKNLDGLVRAMAAVRERVPDARLLAAGRLRHLDPAVITAEIDRLDLRGAVDFRPVFVEDAQVDAYFAAADVVALPYRGITQSGVVFQAMTAGRPVVATDTGALGHTVRESGCGRVVPAGDDQALADALADLLADPARAAEYGERGRAAAAGAFSWERCARETWAVYEEVRRA